MEAFVPSYNTTITSFNEEPIVNEDLILGLPGKK